MIGKTLRLCGIALCVLVSGDCATAGWTAKMVSTVPPSSRGDIKSFGRETTSILYVQDKNIRMETWTGDVTQVVIVGQDRKTARVVLPEMKKYYEIPGDGMALLQQVSWSAMAETLPGVKRVGAVKSEGLPCDKYACSVGPAMNVTIVVQKKLDLPVRMEIEGTHIHNIVEIKNIKEKELPDTLFSVPQGYKKIEAFSASSLETGGMLWGLPAHGLSPGGRPGPQLPAVPPGMIPVPSQVKR